MMRRLVHLVWVLALQMGMLVVCSARQLALRNCVPALEGNNGIYPRSR
jgi:hypothetical protein